MMKAGKIDIVPAQKSLTVYKEYACRVPSLGWEDPLEVPGESQGTWSLVGCHLWGHIELDTTEATYQQQQQPVC